MADLQASLVSLKRRLMVRTRVRQILHHAPRFLRMKFIKTRFGIESIRNYVIDRRFGGSCGGKFPSRFEETGAWGTTSVDYYQLPKIFNERNGIRITDADVLVDVGCGRGRVINWWLSLGLKNRIVGIELDERFASEAAQRLRAYSNVEIICGSALDHIPADATILFLFNPFKAHVVAAFKDRLMERLGPNSGITIIYNMCLYVDVFRDDPRWDVQPIRVRTFWPTAVIRPRRAEAAAVPRDA
jgi:SAM-dependent methyltransferase